jgi:hypothetical protein
MNWLRGFFTLAPTKHHVVSELLGCKRKQPHLRRGPRPGPGSAGRFSLPRSAPMRCVTT